MRTETRTTQSCHCILAPQCKLPQAWQGRWILLLVLVTLPPSLTPGVQYPTTALTPSFLHSAKKQGNSHHNKYRYMPLITTNTGTSSHHNKYWNMPLITSTGTSHITTNTGTCFSSQQMQVHVSHHNKYIYVSHQNKYKYMPLITFTTNAGTSLRVSYHNKYRSGMDMSHITTSTGTCHINHNKYTYMPLIRTNTGACLKSQVQVHVSHHNNFTGKCLTSQQIQTCTCLT